MGEITRHRKMSFSIESTRFCNYKKDKFGSEITYIDYKPFLNAQNEAWRGLLEEVENTYLRLSESAIQPQFSRSILPLSLKTDIIITGYLQDYKDIFIKRDIDAAHPMIRELVKEMKKYLN